MMTTDMDGVCLVVPDFEEALMRRQMVVTAFVLVSVLGCHGDFERGLPNGYRLVRTNAVQTYITPPEGVHHPSHRFGTAVAPNITQVGLQQEMVFGVVEAPPEPEPGDYLQLAHFSVPGYFILNTRTGDVRAGLDEDVWRAALEELGVPPSAQLRHPGSL